MRSTRLLWAVTGTAALLATLLFVFGFVYGVQHLIRPPANAGVPVSTPPAPTGEPDKSAEKDGAIRIVALGDSLTNGTGDATGEGYVGKVKKLLEGERKTNVFVENYAIVGSVLDSMLSQLEQRNIRDRISKADIVLFTIGGNDLNNAGIDINALLSGQSDKFEVDYDAVRGKLPEAEKKFDTILSTLAGLNPKARIVYVGLYHPYLDLDPERKGVPILQEWNAYAGSAASKHPNTTVVPAYDLFQLDLNRYLFVDHFHPNEDGYARIAARVMQVL